MSLDSSKNNKLVKIIYITCLLTPWIMISCEADQTDESKEEHPTNFFNQDELIGDWSYFGKEVFDNDIEFNSVINKTNTSNVFTTDLQITEDSIFVMDYPVTLENRFSYSLHVNAISIEVLRSGESYADLEIRNDTLIFTYKQPDQLKQRDFYVKTTFSSEVVNNLRERNIFCDSLIGIWELDTTKATVKLVRKKNDAYYPETLVLNKEILNSCLNNKNEIIIGEDSIAYSVQFSRGTKGQVIELWNLETKTIPLQYNKRQH